MKNNNILKKIISIIKKYDTIILILILIAISAGATLGASFDANDEMWNFSNTYKMTYGEIIYKDTNVIVTPLFFYIGFILLKILGATIWLFKIYNILIFVILFAIMYEIFKRLKINRPASALYILILFYQYYILMPAGANYSVLGVLLYILGMYFSLKQFKNQKNKDIVQGIFIFLVFLTKQTIGVAYILGMLIYKIFTIKKIKETIISVVWQLGTSLVLLLTFIIALAIRGNLYGFINYAVLGITEFAEKNVHIEIESVQFGVILLAGIILQMILILIKKIPIKEEIRNNMKLLMSFSIPTILICTPIINAYHVICTSAIIYIGIVYALHSTIIYRIAKRTTFKLIFCMVTIFLMVAIFIKNFNGLQIWYETVTHENYYYKTGDVYNGGICKASQVRDINQVVQFIQENLNKGIDVKILSYKSMLYMNILQKNNGAMDLPFLGNLGINGEQSMIEQIRNQKNTKFLITEERGYQESDNIRDYVKNNLEYIGTINEFLIYQTKD